MEGRWNAYWVNTLEQTVSASKISHKDSRPTITHKNLAQKQTITHEDEKVALILSLAGSFAIWYMFLVREPVSKIFRKIVRAAIKFSTWKPNSITSEQFRK